MPHTRVKQPGPSECHILELNNQFRLNATFKMAVNCCQRMCHFGLSLPRSLKPVGGITSHVSHKVILGSPIDSQTSAGRPFSFELNTLGEKVGYYQSLPSDFILLGASYIVFSDEYNPSKIFKMTSNSFEVTDVPF